MVCPRCISAVENVMKEMRVEALYVNLGEVMLKEALNAPQWLVLKEKLEALGFELLDDAKKQTIEKIKSVIIEQIHHLENRKFVFSELLAQQLHKEYSALSKLFSGTEGITIEQYIILQKIEKVKEYLVYDQLNLSEIADQLGYSSVAHLSAQFKKVIGLTPSQFKQQGLSLRKPIDGDLSQTSVKRSSNSRNKKNK